MRKIYQGLQTMLTVAFWLAISLSAAALLVVTVVATLYTCKYCPGCWLYKKRKQRTRTQIVVYVVPVTPPTSEILELEPSMRGKPVSTTKQG